MNHSAPDIFRKSNSELRKEDVDSGEGAVRAIAFYLPQFHPIPENDEWWGRGFTEWINVVRTKPQFLGHYQPHLPADLGFYDLRVHETRAAQAGLAAAYGIYGFCYYHYWFNSRRILERPFNEVWRSGQPDFPFCLCWANENWTRRWDGLETHLLLEQRYSAFDDLAHIQSLIPVFSDPRYIRVNDRPLLLVYRASRLPEPEKTTDLWRREAERAGFKGLFLVRVESFRDERGDPRTIGFDSALEFQPRWFELPRSRILRRKWWHRRKLRTSEPAFFDNCVCEYEDVVAKALADSVPTYPRIPSVCPGWDNSPRRKHGAHILVNSTPGIYERWLAEVVNRLRAARSQGNSVLDEDSLVFINAWNEWGEGTHLEPCQRWGHGYLEATQRALAISQNRATEYANR